MRTWLRVGLLLAWIAFAPAWARAPGPQGEPTGKLREQVFLVPRASDLLLHTIVYRPPGEGRFPLAVVNHGSPRNAVARRDFVARYRTASAWFVAQGFAVAVPTRRGYGPTGGRWHEDYAPCDNPSYYEAGRATAEDIGAAVAYFRTQPFVDPARIVLVGQSAGGWGALASANQDFPGVVAIVNFAGGRGSRSPDVVCTPEALVAAASRYGRGVSVPSLSLYTENDRYFGRSLSDAIFAAFAKGNPGKATLVRLPAFGEDGHGIFGHREGPAIWGPAVETFLKAALPH